MKKLGIIAIATTLFITGCSTVNTEENPKNPAQVKQVKKKAIKKKKKKNSNNKSKQSKKQSPAIADIMLKKLKVAPEERAGYDRDLFNHWTSQSSGCDTRDVVLARQDKRGGACGSDSGLWVSVYDGVRLTDPGDLDVDHMVPLAEAWDSGAKRWASARREAYANDLHPFSLIAVSASSNREKSDQDPAEWLPENNFICQYTARWIAVKFRWRLTIDPAEKQTLTGLVSKCPGSALKLSKNWTKSKVKVKNKKAKKQTNNKKGQQKKGGQDRLFSSCAKATAKGYGPYIKGRDPEYKNYQDADGDGKVCE